MSYKSDYRINGYFEYVVPPLEGVWHQEGVHGIDYANKAAFQWLSVIRLPDFVKKKDFDWALNRAYEKKKIDTSRAEMLTIEEMCIRDRSRR